ncbi:peptidase S24/S26A/S26B/S26C [Phyllosticta citribraziliensis]|uniref:Mitochondrial inner membrane protease subunit n=1 Tax=Phyllosticta citribraziliensis TaxID=989973 RepID=A0ABR1LZ48_9PEZI
MAPTSRWRGLKVGYYTVTSLALLLFVRDSVAEVTPVHGPSMAPTFSPAFHETGRMDRVLFNRLIDPRFLRRGDVVSLWGPHKPEQLSIKRVVGLPGDLVVVGRRPKGRAGGEEQGLHWGKVRVPWNHVWVEGDNWRESVDSTTYGPVPMGLVNGRAEVPDPLEGYTTKIETHNASRVSGLKMVMRKQPKTEEP